MDCSLIAASFSWFSLDSWIGIFWMAIGLGLIIFVHELGHFVAAKSCGVKVEAFYVGFNIPFPKIFGVTIIPQHLLKVTIGETVYGIGNVPLGGYVKMLGQEDTPERPEDQSEGAENGDENREPRKEELDPRDYRAKSVIQRFWIISAGVIMNLVTAPIFAILAFMWGVPQIPARVGSVYPAGPAYAADIHPGDEIIQIGDTKPTSAVTFSDFMEANALAGTNKKAVYHIRRQGVDEPIRKEVQPSNDILKIRYRTIAAVGVGADLSPRLAKEKAIVPGSAAAGAQPPLENGDLILSVNDHPVKHGSDVKREIVNGCDQPIKLVVARLGRKARAEVTDSTERITVMVQPARKKTVGLHMQISPIVCVQPNSPAEAAGLEEGDELLAVNGEPIGNPLTLSQHIRRLARKNPIVQLKIRKSDGTEKTIDVRPRPAFSKSVHDNSPIAIDELGVAIKVLNIVARVEPESPAAEAGLSPGDKILLAEFVVAKEKLKEEQEERGLPEKPFDLATKEFNWPIVELSLQNRLPDTKLKLKVERDSEPLEFTLGIVESEKFYSEVIGIQLSQEEIIKKAGSFGEAVSLGIKKVNKDAGRIFNFLQALVTGKISPTSLGGPLTIGNVAVSFAQENFGKFLSFLAFISVNLAIVNFLPIPVLDGGHAAFLIWEGVTGKPVNENTQYIATLIGFVFLITLMLFVFSLDILTFFF